ncbi:hypothetical protein QU661_00215 [Mogibacterium neglectum]|uniref:hypothetical protein n=1 Tax=Mogibacterium neglectum TaxID=114528 RepID=UPI00272DBEC3|nr:hypothetical protein [Mogibacterium neglectum]WLD76304.1 hypothetical protein QU661_00215 [Mogibacterium neglectum]
MNIKIKNTPEKYKGMADEIILPLLELLKELNSLEEEVFKRNSELNAEKLIFNIPANQNHPKWSGLMAEYESRYKEILKGKASDNLISKGYATHYSNPSEYFYVHSNDFLLEFAMQQLDMAIIIIHFNGATDMKHKFIVRQINKRWVLDEKYYGFSDEEIWYSDSI